MKEQARRRMLTFLARGLKLICACMRRCTRVEEGEGVLGTRVEEGKGVLYTCRGGEGCVGVGDWEKAVL